MSIWELNVVFISFIRLRNESWEFLNLVELPCVRNYSVSYELLSILRERNQLIILREEERSKTLEEVQVLKINTSRRDLATQVVRSS